ncbi:hypothetical protein [Lysobacter sp. GCM10012299]|uniref:hypothetical protein n=1 Tax=Lysobacter sp. GCM10012299 TaxID=3317333 RepID=UPI00360BD221
MTSGNSNPNASTTSLENNVGGVNIPREVRDALKAIESDALVKRIDQCLDEKCLSALRSLRLESCGPYVASNIRKFETALAEYGSAKAAKKLAETETRARRAGDNLARAVQEMKYRAETEETEDQLFHVEDRITPPHMFSEHLTVRVSYRWRPTIEDEWGCGSIIFSHNAEMQPDYTVLAPKRKPSVVQQAGDRQDALYREWEHLMRLALYSVKEYFRDGGSALAIPTTFRAKVDAHTRRLNNFSARFWPVPSSVTDV